MTEAPRVPCCIVGCGRTFRKEDVGVHDEYMCGKHYRVDPELVGRRKRVEARMRRLNTIHRRLQRKQGDVTVAQVATLDRIWEKLNEKRHTLWEAIKALAQDMEYAGYWAPARRTRRKNVEKPSSSPLNSKFEDQFQRMKRAYGGQP